MNRILIAALLVFSHKSYTCETIELADTEWQSLSDAAYYGAIVELSVIESKIEVEVPDPLPSVTPESLLRRQEVMDRVVTIQVQKTIKGTPKRLLSIPVSWCGGGRGAFLEYVTAYKYQGDWHLRGELNIPSIFRFNLDKKAP